MLMRRMSDLADAPGRIMDLSEREISVLNKHPDWRIEMISIRRWRRRWASSIRPAVPRLEYLANCCGGSSANSRITFYAAPIRTTMVTYESGCVPLLPFRIGRLEFLQLFPDHSIDRVRPASPDRDGEHHDAEQQNVLVAALAGLEAVLQMHGEEADQKLDRERRRKETRE